MNFRKRLPIGLLLVPIILKAQTLPTVPIYAYSVPSGGYAPNGNLTSYSDLVTGTWSMQYDNLNRLQGANATSGLFNSAVISWQYDSFGNRLSQTSSGKPGIPVLNAWATYDVNNRMITNQNAVTSGILSYDNAGNMTFDGTNQYLYDAEGRVCASHNTNTGQITQYLYDAEGNRVAKGHPANSTGTLYCPTSRADFTPDETYILGQSGEQVTAQDNNGAWKHSNVYVAGQLIATYHQEGTQQLLHFNVTDPLGTKRVQASASGVPDLTCLSLPFGDGPDCSGPGQEATRHRFTGKERDQESGLDYFGARYYASSMGRWMSPDWADRPEAVPYSDLTDPQSLNLYGYVRNNPLSRTDPDGHQDPCDCIPWYGWTTPSHAGQLANDIVAGAQQRWNNFNSDVKLAAAVVSITANVLLNEAKSSPEAPAPTKAYDTGPANELKGNEQVGDGLDIHHVPQSHPASQIIEGYNRGTAPAVALPEAEHKAIPNVRGPATLSPRDQLAKDVRNLRNHTNTPNTQIQKLIRDTKSRYPEANKPQPQ